MEKYRYSKIGVEKTASRIQKEAAMMDLALKGLDISNDYKPLITAGKQFVKDDGIRWTNEALVKPGLKKAYNKMGFNNQMKVDYIKHNATNAIGKIKPWFNKINDGLYEKIPKKIRTTGEIIDKTKKTIANSFGKI